MVSTHASSFGVIYLLLRNYFDPDYSFVPTFQSAFREIPRILCTRHASIQPGKTLLCPWPFASHPHKCNATTHFSCFHPVHLFGLTHKNTLWLGIGNKPPLATAPSTFFSPQPKNPSLL